MKSAGEQGRAAYRRFGLVSPITFVLPQKAGPLLNGPVFRHIAQGGGRLRVNCGISPLSVIRLSLPVIGISRFLSDCASGVFRCAGQWPVMRFKVGRVRTDQSHLRSSAGNFLR
ncbi:hypothetical protein [Sphaerimonospora thailandensis]|uniref:hypothetical protein n=1 Tax=Sphaerimonospora thailandensis TaxID=795644 RepID=UPI001951C46C|nr:hypothetical protein [Sphaerimonospora thailandensis]